MSNNPRRQPAGIPVGGQYASTLHSESSVALGSGTPQFIPGLMGLSHEALAVLQACRDAGGRPLIVGGSVRDALLGNSDPKDIDIEVHGAGMDQLLRHMTGSAGTHGTLGVLNVSLGGEDFDLSLPRATNEAEDQMHDVGIEDAFGRRDFTINAMGWDPFTGELLDPHGGVADMKAGILRITRPQVEQSPAVPLRGIRFAGQFGYAMSPETVQTCRDMLPVFGSLDRSRVWNEFRRISAEAGQPSKSVQALYDTGWASHFPVLDAGGFTGAAADAAAQSAQEDGVGAGTRSVVVLAALMTEAGTGHGGAEEARQFLNSIGATAKVKDQVLALVREQGPHSPGDAGAAGVRRLIRRLDEGANAPGIQEWARVTDARMRAEGLPPAGPAWLDAARSSGGLAPAPPLLQGRDLVAAGIRPGPELGKVIRASLDAQDDGEFTDTAGALSWALRNAAKAPAEGAGHEAGTTRKQEQQ